MPRRTRGPFLELQNLPALDANSSDIVIGLGDDAPPPDDLMERMDLLNTVLADAGCNCNGHHAGHQRDEYFGADIASSCYGRCLTKSLKKTQMVSRCR